MFKRFLVTCLMLHIVVLQAQEPWHKVVELYKNQLIAQEHDLMQQFFTLFNITEVQWQAHKRTSSQAHLIVEQEAVKNLTINSQVNPSIKNMVHALCTKINCRPVDVLAGDTTLAKHSAIFISPDFAYRHGSPEQQQVSVLHELYHIVFEDDFTGYCLNSLKDTCINKWLHMGSITFDVDRWNALLHDWQIFREKRADIMASLVSPRYAKLHADFWQQYNNRFITTKAEHHPECAERLVYCSQIAHDMAII